MIQKDRKDFSAKLGVYQEGVTAALAEMQRDRIIPRIWAHDHTVWEPEPVEITNRLGWLHSPEAMLETIPRLHALAEQLRAEGFRHALLLGMGGSSLAPEVFRRTFGVGEGYLDLAILDSTDPDAVKDWGNRLDLSRTLFIVSTKSGGTVETFSFFKYFYQQLASYVGKERVGDHFIAITDPGSGLAEIAQKHDFRATFLNDPNIGGRYSALTYFGLVPAALIGADLKTLLERASTAASNCKESIDQNEGVNLGAHLGAILGELAKAGRDKLTLVTSTPISSFADWVEQLVAESTGKDGTGILPVVGESPGTTDVYGNDRLFVNLRMDGDSTHDEMLNALKANGHPVVRLELKDAYDLGAQIFYWEMATAVAGYRLGIHPFDQPNVEAAKVQARKMVSAYHSEGKLPEPTPDLQLGEITIYLDQKSRIVGNNPGEILNAFLHQAQPGDYVAMQAYVQPGPEMDEMLGKLRERIRSHTQLATTIGYGPRFLHSTGQLHKGDAGNGLFIQFTSQLQGDVAIPDEADLPDSSMSFGVLKLAQALGDRQALLDNRRRIIRIHLGERPVASLETILKQLI